MNNLTKIKARHYQPLVNDNKFWKTEDKKYLDACGERLCLDRAKIIFDNIGDDKGKSILDIGCNIGFFCHFGENRGFKMTGVENDIHEKVKKFTGLSSVNVARKLNRNYKLSPEFIDDDYIEVVENRKFDYILYLSVWHHHLLGYGHTDFQRMIVAEAEQIFLKVWNATKIALFFETDGFIKQLVEQGWGDEELEENLKRLTGKTPKLIHTSPDGWVNPRKMWRINKRGK